jgi:hypothetical protein
MSAAIIASLSPVTLTVDGGAEVTIPVESVGIPLGIMQKIHHHSGNVFATAVVVGGADRRVTLSVPMKIALTTFGLGLVKLTTFSAFLAKFADYNRLATASHLALRMVAGCAAAAQITGWSVSVDGILMANIEIVPLSTTGQLDPLELVPTQSLPAITGSPDLHTLGPVSINSTVIPGLSSMSGSIGSSIAVQRTDGDLYARVAARIEATPTMSLTHEDPTTILQAVSLMGATIVSVVVYAKAFDPTTGIAVQAGSLSFTMVSGRIHPSGPDASQGGVASTGLEVIGISDTGAVNPIAISTSVVAPVSP